MAPAEGGPGSASGSDQGGERAEAGGSRGGPSARGKSGSNGPPEDHDVQGTPHQASASGGLKTAGGPGVPVPLARSRINQVPSDHGEASPGAQDEASNAPLRPGDRSSSSGRSTGEKSRGGGTTPSGGGSPDPSEAGRPIAHSVKGAPRKSSSVAQAHPHDLSETVAPDVVVAQVVPVLRKLEDLLRSNQVGPALERESGISREQMEQFVTRFKRLRNAAPGPGRTVEVEPGHERAFHDEPTSIALDWETLGNLATRLHANVVDDQQRDIVEATRFVVPSGLRSGFEAYKSSLSHSIPTRP
jgi:hypothetical protein